MIEPTPASVRQVYEQMQQRLEVVRKRLGRPLTFAEKLLYGHLDDPQDAKLDRGRAYVQLRPDRITMQDATAQMAILQFLTTGKDRAAVPTTVHCDHLIAAKAGAGPDLHAAQTTNEEVYEFLRTASQRCGLGFWKPGAGIIHQVALEQYGFPGQMIIGTDSHTPNGGGLGQWASGVGGADAVDVMADMPWEVLHPRIIGVKLTGQLSGWTAPKDVILKLCGILTVKGGTNAMLEYFGDGGQSISATGKSTITNMGAELGATTSVFPHDERMNIYLRATDRADLADLADEYHDMLVADPEVLEEPEKYFDEIVEIDLSTLEPHLVGPHTPDLARPVSGMAKAVDEEGYPDEISASLIGSCTNSSYEDIVRTVAVAKQALQNGIKSRTPLLVTPGSEQVHLTIQRDGLMQQLNDAGAVVLANACGPCIGQWNRAEAENAQENTIVTSYNRNFPKRNDGSAKTMAFMGSPEIVMAYALAGRLSFNPLKDPIVVDGKEVFLQPPAPAPEVPADGFEKDPHGYVAPPADTSDVEVVVAPDSERLQLLEPFPPRTVEQLQGMPLLLKAKGKCTTDHISQAGPWLRFRGHLDNISDNCYIGVNSAFHDQVGGRKDEADGKVKLYPEIARRYKAEGVTWAVVGDENFGEGSSREHAAMEPRHLGCALILVRSFARIHETNLKKQGILPLTFVDAADYEKVREWDRISIPDIEELAPGHNVTVTLTHEDGSQESFEARHTLNDEQVRWFWAGSALNLLRKQ